MESAKPVSKQSMESVYENIIEGSKSIRLYCDSCGIGNWIKNVSSKDFLCDWCRSILDKDQ